MIYGYLAVVPVLSWAEQASQPTPSVTEREERSYWETYFTDPETGDFDVSNYLSKAPLGFLPIPTIITDPATGGGLALEAMFFHESDEQR